MTNHVYTIDSKPYYRLVYTDRELLITSKKTDLPAEVQAAVEKGGMMSSNRRIALSDVTALEANTSSSSVKIRYRKEGKKKSQSVDFSEDETALSFSEALAGTLGLPRHEEQEGIIGQLMATAVPVLLAGGLFALVASLDGSEDLSGTSGRRSRGFMAIIRLGFDFIGKTGMLLLCGLILAVTLYLLVDRLRNPATNVAFGKTD